MDRDRLESNNAATALIAHLDGKAIIGTSGDAGHRLNVTDAKLDVKLTKTGEELEIVINQADTHHPGSVYDTIKKYLSEMDELKGYAAKEVDPKHDHNSRNGIMTIHYELPNATADSVIHSLSNRAQKEHSMDKLLGNAEKSSGGWVEKVTSYFSPSSYFRG